MLCISRKVKKSESKSQQSLKQRLTKGRCVYLVKLKNLKANHNKSFFDKLGLSVVYIS